mmetsp:Transcript_11549/g.23002  ORF Transcript_11549/g.23002 Transcript_11549/m.23002 type:complete len:163 (-) Transcript_11549:179-667(-)|eukprot:CAMPEP_0194314754 /NCGR_PEP_ID=MMETSP0171-20130528/11596_1 /TAXON_ID=218684 /ORGANISM="Corethron pennatum, Strain L29A3" /LENGTH=162 /DNA_ID=CAMNT_0039070309 /DNA_START=762 /DNA_END=1250 /DNA_ORIENTATION=-
MPTICFEKFFASLFVSFRRKFDGRPGRGPHRSGGKRFRGGERHQHDLESARTEEEPASDSDSSAGGYTSRPAAAIPPPSCTQNIPFPDTYIRMTDSERQLIVDTAIADMRVRRMFRTITAGGSSGVWRNNDRVTGSSQVTEKVRRLDSIDHDPDCMMFEMDI